MNNFCTYTFECINRLNVFVRMHAVCLLACRMAFYVNPVYCLHTYSLLYFQIPFKCLDIETYSSVVGMYLKCLDPIHKVVYKLLSHFVESDLISLLTFGT